MPARHNATCRWMHSVRAYSKLDEYGAGMQNLDQLLTLRAFTLPPATKQARPAHKCTSTTVVARPCPKGSFDVVVLMSGGLGGRAAACLLGGAAVKLRHGKALPRQMIHPRPRWLTGHLRPASDCPDFQSNPYET